MKSYIELGPTPTDEECVQVGSEEYESEWKKEGKRYIELLQKLFPQYEEFGTSFSIKSFPHDFGTYHEVVIWYEEDTPGEEFVYFVENHLPRTWNDDQIMVAANDEKQST